jgi:hypothetical protein
MRNITKAKESVQQTFKGIMTDFYNAKTRAQQWNFLASTEFKNNLDSLNEHMATMDDEKANSWFIKTAIRYIDKTFC